jgi:hypothetical protein
MFDRNPMVPMTLGEEVAPAISFRTNAAAHPKTNLYEIR